MKLCVLTFTYDGENRRFDCPELSAFLAENRVKSIYPEFVSHEGELIWAVLVTYEARERGIKGERRSMRPEAVLNEQQLEVYNTLRRWRNEKAKEIGKPAYVLFTNDIAVRIVKGMPKTLADLEKVPGMGKARMEELGKEVLGVLELGRRVAVSDEGGAADEGEGNGND